MLGRCPRSQKWRGWLKSPRTVTHMHRSARSTEAGVEVAADRAQSGRRSEAAQGRAQGNEGARRRRRDRSSSRRRAGPTCFRFILICVMTGVRRSEAAALRWRNVDLDRGQLSIVASTRADWTRAACEEKETKSGKQRSIALSPNVVDELRRHWAPAGRDDAEAWSDGSLLTITSSLARTDCHSSRARSPRRSGSSAQAHEFEFDRAPWSAA